MFYTSSATITCSPILLLPFFSSSIFFLSLSLCTLFPIFHRYLFFAFFQTCKSYPIFWSLKDRYILIKLASSFVRWLTKKETFILYLSKHIKLATLLPSLITINRKSHSNTHQTWRTTKRKWQQVLPHHHSPTLIIFLVPRTPPPLHLHPPASLAPFSHLLPLLEGEIQQNKRWDAKIMEHQAITVTKVKTAVSPTRMPVPIIRMSQWSPVVTTVHQSFMVVKKIIPQEPGPLNPTTFLRKIRKTMIQMVTIRIVLHEGTGGKVLFIINICECMKSFPSCGSG